MNDTKELKTQGIKCQGSGCACMLFDTLVKAVALEMIHPYSLFLKRLTTQGFFSKFLMAGTTQKFWSPSVPDGDEVRWGGGGFAKKIQLRPKLPT